MNWSKYPFLRLLPALLLGILLGEALGPCPVGRKPLFFLLLGMVLVLVVLSRALKPYRHRWIVGVWMLLTLVYLGWFRQGMVHDSDGAVPIGRQGLFLARVLEPPVEKERSVKVMLALRGGRTDNGDQALSGRVMAYFEKSAPALALRYGDLIAFSGTMESVPPPLNPEEFDYRTYLRRQGVSGRVYLKGGRWCSLGLQEGNPLWRLSYRCRERLLEALQRCGVTEEAFGVAAALLLGYDESLPVQLRQRYVAAGAMHVLCVSGMHVGVVYLLASALLGLLGKGKRMFRMRKRILLGLVWCYALLTGLSPSVLRATMMISFLLLGSLLRRKGNTLNSIAASAFVLLVIRPDNLFSIGFQLSYAAVLGIVLLQRKIYLLLYIENKWLDKVWEITAVSLAAQFSTLPLTLYHFHQFTPYFWLSNLFLTPLSFAAILSGMGLLAVSWVPWLGSAVGKGVWACMTLMNTLVSWVEGLPFSLVRGLYINKVQLVLALLLLTLTVLFIHLKRKRMLMEGLVVAVGLAFSLVYHRYTVSVQDTVTLYSLRKHTCLDLSQGTDHLMLCDEGLLKEPGVIDYSLRGHWARQHGSMNPPCYTLRENVEGPFVRKRGNLLSFSGMLLGFWEPPPGRGAPDTPLLVDGLLVRDRQRPDLAWVLQCYRPALLLIDGSVPSYMAEEWMRQARERGIPYYNIGEGAWTRSL